MPDSSEPGTPGPDALLLHLDGFDGPLDLLLDMARAHKLDLARISILALVDQYLGVIEGARRVRLELAADWLVMAAWLAWLKSRLLLPPGTEDADEGEQAADALAGRLRDLAAVRVGAARLTERPQLGQDVFARGAPERFTYTDRTELVLDAPSLIRAYLVAVRRGAAGRTYTPPPPALWSVADAMRRLLGLGQGPWADLRAFLPERGDALQRRAATASTLIAGLELAREGTMMLRQESPFGPILLRRADPSAP